MIIRWGTIKGCSGIWGQRSSRGHLGSCSNTLKMLRLHDLIDFGETWGKRSLAEGSIGVFGNF